MRLSALFSVGAEWSPLQFLFWFRKSYSKKTEALASVAIIGLEETSNTPQPQAQARASLGAKIRGAMLTATRAMAARPWLEKSGMRILIEQGDSRARRMARGAGQCSVGLR